MHWPVIRFAPNMIVENQYDDQAAGEIPQQPAEQSCRYLPFASSSRSTGCRRS
jgi:hypothetical protein